MTRGEMMHRMSARELDAWAAYNAQWPVGEMRADIRAGVVAAVVANAHRDPEKQSEPFAPADFMLYAGERETSPEEIALRFQAATGVYETVEVPEGFNRFGYEDE